MATIRGRAGLAQTSGGKWSGDCTIEVTFTDAAVVDIGQDMDFIQALIRARLPETQDFIDAEVKRRNGG